MSYSFEEVVNYAGGSIQNVNVGQELWDSAMAKFPQGGPDFIQEQVWLKAAKDVGFSEATISRVGKVAEFVKKDIDLQHLMWLVFCHYTNFEKYNTPNGAPGINCPEPGVLGDYKGSLYMLCALGFVPLVWKYHKSLGIPESVTLETLKKFREHCEIYYKGDNGVPGLNSARLYWLSHYMHLPLFRLGRFEYMLQPSNMGYMVYRRKADGMTVAFPVRGRKFTYDGMPVDELTPADAKTWESEFEDDGHYIIGTPYEPSGVARRSLFMQPSADWQQVFAPGDYVAAMHIPFGGGMTPQRCKESLSAVKPFFDKYFPQTPIKLIQCTSWIFGTHLEQVLPYDANLLDQQHNVYLMPYPCGKYWGIGFLFPNFPANPDFDKLPQDNSMRRAVVKFLKSGGRWRAGSMFILPEDLQHYGEKIYLSRWYASNLS